MSRFLSMITSAVPPEIIFVSSGSAASSETASSTDVGCKNLMLGMLIEIISFLSLLCRCEIFLLLQRAQYFLRCNRQIEKMDSNSAANGIPNRGASWWYRCLTDAVDIGDAVRFQQVHGQLRRHIFKRRNHVVGKVRIGDAAFGIHRQFLKQYLAKPKSRRALRMQLRAERVDHLASVQLGMQPQHLHLSGLRVYFHLADHNRRVPLRRSVTLAGFKVHHYGTTIRSRAGNKDSMTQKVVRLCKPYDIDVGNGLAGGATDNNLAPLQYQILFGGFELSRGRFEQLLPDIFNRFAYGRAHAKSRTASRGHQVEGRERRVRLRDPHTLHRQANLGSSDLRQRGF